MDIYTIVIAVGSAVIGCVVALLLKGALGSKKLKDAGNEAEKIVKAAKTEADGLIKEAGIEAKDRLFKMKSDFDSEAKETRSELKKLEHRLIQKEENIDRKTEQFERRDREQTRRERHLTKREGKLERKELEFNELIEEQKRQLVAYLLLLSKETQRIKKIYIFRDKL